MKTARPLLLALTVSALSIGFAPDFVQADTTITAIDALIYGQPSQIQGVIEARLDDDEFLLRDDSGEIEVYTGRDWNDYEIGDTVTVSGRLDNDDEAAEFYARSVVLRDGTVIEMDAD